MHTHAYAYTHTHTHTHIQAHTHFLPSTYHPVIHHHQLKQGNESGSVSIEVVAEVILIGVVSALEKGVVRRKASVEKLHSFDNGEGEGSEKEREREKEREKNQLDGHIINMA